MILWKKNSKILFVNSYERNKPNAILNASKTVQVSHLYTAHAKHLDSLGNKA